LTVELSVSPRGPYSLALSARLASDATRTFRDGVLTQALAVDDRVELARAWQSPSGTVTIRADSEPAATRVRWLLALDDDHSAFLLRVRDDPFLGTASRALRGLRPVRVPTVALALLRAFCGQLIEAKRARRLEQVIVRTLCAAAPERLHVAPTTHDLGALAPSQLRALGLHAQRAASLVRLCRSLELERLHDQPTAAVVRRLERERGLGPGSVGMVCLHGLGRFEHGLVGDLGLVKLLRAIRGRPVEGWETAALVESYGEWAGLASIYMLAAFGRGLLPLDAAAA
jgi:3-methyladenine DNA glycosylase/8-oxoguanine DNA glycosylase